MTFEQYSNDFEELVKQNMRNIDARYALMDELERYATTESYVPNGVELKRLYAKDCENAKKNSAELGLLSYRVALFRMAIDEINSLKCDLMERDDR